MITLSVLITSHAAVTASHIFFFPFPAAGAEERPGEISPEEILSKLQLRKKLATIIHTPRRLIRILLTRRKADVYVFISHENSTIPIARKVKRNSRDCAEKNAFLATRFKHAVLIIFYGVRSFKLDIEF